jgi:hypothetical protein
MSKRGGERPGLVHTAVAGSYIKITGDNNHKNNNDE